jgi:hypothetical protein
MPDYTPVFSNSEMLTFTAGAAITAGQLLAITGDNQVSPTGGATSAIAGVAGHDAAQGAAVTVYGGGGVVHETASTAAAVAAGALLQSAAGGAVAGGAASGADIGIAVRSVPAAGGTLRWKSTRG